MILVDSHLRWAMGLDRTPPSDLVPSGCLLIEGGAPMVQPMSVDLTLDDRFLVPIPGHLIQADKGYEPDQLKQHRSRELVLHPGDFVLGATAEKITMPRFLCAQVDGRSSMGRMGVAVHVTAGFIDPGFSGAITLEIVNFSRSTVVIPAGHRVCQLVVMKGSGLASRPYGANGLGSRYVGVQDGPVAPMAD